MWRSEEEMLARVHRQAAARQRRRRRRIVAGGGAGLALVSVLGVSLALASSGGPPRKLRTVGPPTASPSTTATVPAMTAPTTSALPASVAGPASTTPRTAPALPTARIAYETVDVTPQRGSVDIHVVDPRGGHDQIAVLDGTSPSWSPDHTKLAFVRRTMSGADDLYVADADGSHERLLLGGQPNTAGPGNPAWSPDGREIAFLGLGVSAPSPNGGQASYGQVAIVNADGTRPRRLTHELTNLSGPTWSPDGRRLAFVSTEVISNGASWSSRVETINADGTGQVTLTSQTGQAGSPSWSPDGRSIAFTSSRTGSAQIYLIDPDGTGLRPLTAGPGVNGDPAWSPDGSQIAFDTDRDFSYAQEHPDPSASHSLTKIYVMNADGTSPRKVTDGSEDIVPAWR